MKPKNQSAEALLKHLLKMQADGVDLSKVETWGWDDGTIIFDNHGSTAKVSDFCPEYVSDDTPYWYEQYPR